MKADESADCAVLCLAYDFFKIGSPLGIHFTAPSTLLKSPTTHRK